MKLWNDNCTQEEIESFTVGNDRQVDLKLAKYDVIGSIAHCKMLRSVGLISDMEEQQIIACLEEIGLEINSGNFQIENEFEDIHSKIEYLLTQKLGEVGKKIHTGRSRNDQILVDLYLYFKSELHEIKNKISILFHLLIELACENKLKFMPGYTHMQIAMPSSFGMWFSAFAELLIDDVIMLNAAFKIVDQNPLGSAAGYGSSFPIDRSFTTKILDFSTLKYNSSASQISRGKTEKAIAFAISTVANTLSKFANDVVLYSGQNYQFIKLDDEITTGSSIMPHKKNPDVFELIRAKCNKLSALPFELSLLTTNLHSGYHRDFQILKEPLISSIEELKKCLDITIFSCNKISINTTIEKNELYDPIYSVERVNELVVEGKSFRDAYREVAKQINSGEFNPKKSLHHTHEGSIGNLCLSEIKNKFNMHS